MSGSTNGAHVDPRDPGFDDAPTRVADHGPAAGSWPQADTCSPDVDASALPPAPGPAEQASAEVDTGAPAGPPAVPFEHRLALAVAASIRTAGYYDPNNYSDAGGMRVTP